MLSPVVRRLFNEHGWIRRTCPAPGPAGGSPAPTCSNVIDTRGASGAPRAGGSARPRECCAGDRPARETVHASGTDDGLAGTDEVIPFTNIRRRTAEHMVRSKATSPHTLVVLEADYENVERTRRSEGNAFKAEEGFSLTYLPFIARATVEALHEWPNLNASVGDDSLIVHHGINLGVAVDLDHQGLIVPGGARCRGADSARDGEKDPRRVDSCAFEAVERSTT